MTYKTGLMIFRDEDNGFCDWKKDFSKTENNNLCNFPELVYEQPPKSIPSRAEKLLNTKCSKIFEMESPELIPDFSFSSCISSWNVELPKNCWLEVKLRVKIENKWSMWFSMGRWSLDTKVIPRHSVPNQKDEQCEVDTDTLNCSNGTLVSSLQVSLNIYENYLTQSCASLDELKIYSLAVTYSGKKPDQKEISTSEFSLKQECIVGETPCSSQMVYPEGGNVWCSPTSLSMITGFWSKESKQNDERTLAAVNSVFDYIYRGQGNWSFNVAYASSLGFEAYVVRFSSLNKIEAFIKAHMPVALSISWNKSTERSITNAPCEKSNGHLTTIVGFTSQGDAVMNDPASHSVSEVRRIYSRAELEKCWLSASGGVAYIVFPRNESGKEILKVLRAQTAN